MLTWILRPLVSVLCSKAVTPMITNEAPLCTMAA